MIYDSLLMLVTFITHILSFVCLNSLNMSMFIIRHLQIQAFNLHFKVCLSLLHHHGFKDYLAVKLFIRCITLLLMLFME